MTVPLIVEYVTLTTPPDRMEWLLRFLVDGFTVDGIPGDRPTEPLTLYRGSAPTRHDGLSWTTSPGVAIRWATSDGQRNPVGRCWVIESCPFAAMLATYSGRHGAEVLVDTTHPGVVIRPWTTAEIAAAMPLMQRSEQYGVAPPKTPVQTYGYLKKSNPSRMKKRAGRRK